MESEFITPETMAEIEKIDDDPNLSHDEKEREEDALDGIPSGPAPVSENT